jgi:hypothetical protein
VSYSFLSLFVLQDGKSIGIRRQGKAEDKFADKLWIDLRACRLCSLGVRIGGRHSWTDGLDLVTCTWLI